MQQKNYRNGRSIKGNVFIVNNKEESIQKHLEDSRAEKKETYWTCPGLSLRDVGEQERKAETARDRIVSIARGNTIRRQRQGQNMRREAWEGEKGPDANVRAL